MSRGLQRVFVVDDRAPEDDLRRVRPDRPLTLAAPTAASRRVVERLGLEPVPLTLLAPVRVSDGHRPRDLEALVRSHASADRFRDVVVVCDADTARLVARGVGDVRTTAGAVTVLGLPRGERPAQPLWWALLAGLVLAVVAGALVDVVTVVVPPLLAALAGAALWPVPGWRPLARTVLVAAAVATVLLLLGITSAGRFPAA